VLWLEDRGTAAGTYLNGQRLRGRQSAQPGDILQVGPFSARIGGTALEPLDQVAGVDIGVSDARVDAPGRGRTLLQHVWSARSWWWSCRPAGPPTSRYG
jgi:pSer/pThr/pTyr-binding forkhead associated (FHA) protein